MKRSQVIALAGISGALSYVCVILSFYGDIMSLSLGALAGICLMLPLVVDSKAGAIFAYISASILSLVTVGFGALTYVIFFGPFTIIAYLVDFVMYDKWKAGKALKISVGYIIKGVYYAVAVTSVYFIFKPFIKADDIFETKWIWAGIVMLILIFFLFDKVLHMVYLVMKKIIVERILKVRPPHENVDRRADTTSHDVDVFSDDTDTSESPGDTPSEEDGIDESTRRFEHFIEREDSGDDSIDK